MDKITIILDVSNDPNIGRHIGTTRPLGKWYFTYPYKEGQAFNSLRLDQGLNQHISKDEWELVTGNKIEDLLDNKVLVIIPEMEPTDETDELTIYTVRNAQKVIDAQTDVNQLNLWARNASSKPLINSINNRLTKLGR